MLMLYRKAPPNSNLSPDGDLSILQCAKTPFHPANVEDRKVYFFLPFALPLPALPVEATLLARDVAGEAFPFTVSSALFCSLLVEVRVKLVVLH